MSGSFKPKPLPEDLTAAMRAGVQDIPKAIAPAHTEQPTAPPAVAVAPVVVQPQPIEASQQASDEADPPLRAAPPDDVAKRFTSFRLPVSLDEDLRAMIYETRRSKQDLLIEFVTEGVKVWRKSRAVRGG